MHVNETFYPAAASAPKPRRVAFALCGSFCTLEPALAAMQRLAQLGWEVLPILSWNAATLDTRFGTAAEWKQRIAAAAGRPPLETLQQVEPLGPKNMAEALVIAPCTGSTLARLAGGFSDTPVTLAAKSLLRGAKPVVIGVSTNDGLGASAQNIGLLLNRKHYYFVPFAQDDYLRKPQSLKADLTLVPETLEQALRGRQYQPVLLA